MESEEPKPVLDYAKPADRGRSAGEVLWLAFGIVFVGGMVAGLAIAVWMVGESYGLAAMFATTGAMAAGALAIAAAWWIRRRLDDEA